MNSHAEIQRRLSAYCGGDLDASERQLVELHLAACPSCRAELANLQTTHRLIRSTPEVEPPTWMTSRIMAHLREEKTEKRSWLQLFRFPLHRAFPANILALLVVCVSGYYLSRSVETELKQSAPQELQKIPAQQLPVQAPPATQQPDRINKTEPSAPVLPQKAATPDAPPQPAPRQEDLAPQIAPQLQSVPAPAPRYLAPSASALKDQFGGKSESMKAAPAFESSNRAQEAASEKKAKSNRRIESISDTTAPAGRAAGVPAGVLLPQMMVRLNITDPSEAPALIRQAVSRSGGSVNEDQSKSLQRFKVRIPADRQNELLERLQQFGRITERPAAPPSGTQLLELTIQW